jgi:phosphoglycerate dehydrogenase-like enzyme
MFTTTSGIHAIQMAEYVFAMILALAHRVTQMVEDQSAVKWPEDRWGRYVPNELFGSVLGIVGYGSIGRQIARLADAFGMRVLATKRNTRSLHHDGFSIPDTGDPEAEIPERIYPPEALHSFLAECDYVVITTPLTGQTHHLIDESALGAMKPKAILVNVSRGDVVDEDALAKAIQGNKIGGAALDVYSQEPLSPDSPLWKLPNVLLSPHVSGFSAHYDRRAVDVFAENLRRFLNEEPLLNLVERGRGY